MPPVFYLVLTSEMTGSRMPGYFPCLGAANSGNSALK